MKNLLLIFLQSSVLGLAINLSAYAGDIKTGLVNDVVMVKSPHNRVALLELYTSEVLQQLSTS